MGYTVSGKHISSALNVKNYGVVGDGSTDDSDKLNAVLARSDCDSVYLPGGTYLINKTIQVPDGKKLFGDGDTSKIKLASSFDLTSYPWRSESGHRTKYPLLYVGANCVLSDFCVEGDLTEARDMGQVGIMFHGNNTVCRDVSTYNINYFPDAFIGSNQQGYGPNDLCPGFGLFIFGADNVSVYGGRYDGNGYQGIGVENANNIVLQGCYVGDSNRTGIQIHRYSKAVVIDGCIVHNENDDKATDIMMHGSKDSGNNTVKNVIIRNCIAYSSTGHRTSCISTVWGFEEDISIIGCNLQSDKDGIWLCAQPDPSTGGDGGNSLRNAIVANNNIIAGRNGVRVYGDKVVVVGNNITYGTEGTGEAVTIINGENKVVANNLSITGAGGDS